MQLGKISKTAEDKSTKEVDKMRKPETIKRYGETGSRKINSQQKPAFYANRAGEVRAQ